MKPPIEYRPASPAPKAGGEWVWVPDGFKITKRDKAKYNAAQAKLMRERRARQKAKAGG